VEYLPYNDNFMMGGFREALPLQRSQLMAVNY